MRISDLPRAAVAALVLGVGLVNLSCSGGGNPPPPPGVASGHAYVFIGDAPPAGTTILKFEITLSSATLCPAVGTAGECQGTPQVSLMDAPLNLDLNSLQLGSAFVGSKSVQAGTYAGVKLTFGDYNLKLILPDGTIQELNSSDLPLVSASVTPTFSSGLTVYNDVNFGLVLDFDANNSVQSTATAVTGVLPVVRLVELPFAAQQPIITLAGRKGRVSSLVKACPNGTFTLTDSLTGATIANIGFDNSTLIGEPTDETANKDITCDTLANDQIVEVDIAVATDAHNSVVYSARQIQFVGTPTGERLQGTIFQVNGPTEFVLLVESQENLSSIPTGSFVTVRFDPLTVQFRIDASTLPVTATDFATGNDLLAGQRLKVDVTSGSLVLGAGGCARVTDLCIAQADSLRLKETTLSGRVAVTNPPQFTVDSLPSVLGIPPAFLRPLSADCQSCAIGSVRVTASESTGFEDGLTGVWDLTVNSTVTVRGLLVKNGFTGPGPTSPFPPHLVASKVRRQRTL